MAVAKILGVTLKLLYLELFVVIVHLPDFVFAVSDWVAGYPGRDSRRVSDVTEKLAYLKVSSNKVSDASEKLAHLKAGPQSVRQPPRMKAGGWHGLAGFLANPDEAPAPRSYYPRKVAG